MGKNQKGVSLVEVLAIIVVTSFILILVWSVFFQGSDYSNKSISKSFMQQEANNIVINLKKIHQTYDSYTVNATDCSIEITGENKGVKKITQFKNDKLCIVLYDVPSGKISPKITNTFNFSILITDKENIKNLDNSIDKNNLKLNIKDVSKLIQIDSSLHRIS